MNKLTKYSSLSLACIFAISGCGGGGGGTVISTEKQVHQSTYIQKDGLSGVVIAQNYIQGAKVCFDTNINGKCDFGEAATNSFKDGKFSFSSLQTSNNANAPLLAEVGHEYTMMAHQKASNQVISPFTTIVYNEQLFNPYSSGDNLDSIDYLMNNTTLFKRENLEGSDYIKVEKNLINLNALDIVNTLKSSYHKSSDTLLTIAASVDSMVKQNSLSVDVSSIPNQTRYDTSYSLEANGSFDIPSQDGNQRTVGLATNYNSAVVHSKWNNRLTIIDKNNINNRKVKNYLDGDNGDTITSGASEKILSKLIVTNSDIYSLVKKDKSKNTDYGLGIYRGEFGGDDVPNFKYGTLSEGANYYKNSDFNAFALHQTSQKLIASSLSGNIYIFNSKNFSNPQVVNTGSTISDIAFSSDGSHYFLAYDKKLHIYSMGSNSIVSSYPTPQEIKQILTVDENRVLIVLKNSNKVILLNVSNPNNIMETSVYNTSKEVNKISLSEDKKSFICIFENSGNLTSFLLDRNDVKSTSTVSRKLNDVIFINNSKIIGISDFKAFLYNLKGEGTKPNLEQKEAWRNNHRK